MRVTVAQGICHTVTFFWSPMLANSYNWNNQVSPKQNINHEPWHKTVFLKCYSVDCTVSRLSSIADQVCIINSSLQQLNCMETERFLLFHQDSLCSGSRVPLHYWSVSAFQCLLHRLWVPWCSQPCHLTPGFYVVMGQTPLRKECWRTSFVFLVDALTRWAPQKSWSSVICYCAITNVVWNFYSFLSCFK